MLTRTASITSSYPSSAQRSPEIESTDSDTLTRIEAPNRAEVAVRVEALGKRYGQVDAVSQVSFELRYGEILGLLGLNGAGKTTLISMLATQRYPSAGDARIAGKSIRNDIQAIRQIIGLAPQEIALYPTLTAAENLRFFGRIYGVRRAELAERVEQLLRFVGLNNRADQRVDTFSGGMKRRLNLAVALVHRPKLILLDEPTAGVDPQSREEILNLVRRLRDGGNAILYTTHYMEEAEKLCDRLGILNQGKLVALGSFETLLRTLPFSETIELKDFSPRTDLSPLLTAGGTYHAERNHRTLQLFVKRAADFLQPLEQIVARDQSARIRIAPISLENLFLYLTRRESGQ